MNFKVGEIAIYCNLVYLSELNGSEVEITGALEYRYSYSAATGEQVERYEYETCNRDGKLSHTRPKFLKKLPPKDDTCSWDECEWQPIETPVMENAG